MWSTRGSGSVEGAGARERTTAVLTAVPSDGLTLVETGETVDGTITEVLADEESLLWVQFRRPLRRPDGGGTGHARRAVRDPHQGR
ncbi:hypothetical protein [Pseudarthrobacter chlorophenolicus]|uniref:hypothetical protein n=1 Tax=Pseudarthrobacter chlorophenolicus TaxID=85085 RepID=UPI003908AAB0